MNSLNSFLIDISKASVGMNSRLSISFGSLVGPQNICINKLDEFSSIKMVLANILSLMKITKGSAWT